ncbi:MAG: CHAT domain-containing tetratricopeptide repeat protein, partial [Blastocatellia bacterium]
AYFYLGDYKKARENFLRALQLHRELKNLRGQAVTLYAVGSVYLMLGDPNEALEQFKQSLSFRQTVEDKVGQAITLAGMGKAYKRLNRFDEALRYLNEALTVLTEVTNRAVEADTLSNIGWVYVGLEQPGLALTYLQKGLEIARFVGDAGGQAMTLYGMAKAEDRKSNLKRARDYIDEALNIVEGVRLKVTSAQLRASYSASVEDYYEFYIDLLMRLNRAYPRSGYNAEALRVSERARARSLLDLITEARADIRRGVDPALLQSESKTGKQLNSRMDYRIRLLSASRPTEVQMASLNDEIMSLQRTYDTVQQQIRRSSPRYAAIAYPTVLTLAQAQSQLLGPSTALLTYKFANHHCYLWFVTSSSVASFELTDSPSLINSAASQILDGLTEKGDSLQTFENRAVALSKILFPESVQRQLVSKKVLVIVADGILQRFPFSILSTSASYVPLISSHVIITLPSLSTLAVLREEFKDRKPASKSIFVIADPIFEPTDERVQATSPDKTQPAQSFASDLTTGELASLLHPTTRAGLHLSRLKSTRREAEILQNLSPNARIALDFDANLTIATSPQLAQYRIIHFATHGIAPDDYPQLSGVVLSLVDREGKWQEGYLSLPLVYNLNLKADLVVLSACETGLVKEVKGEGLVGLTRGFMYAGAPRVVASLWKVKEKATEELMTRFYQAVFRERMQPAEALQRAAASMWREQKWAPSDWAGFAFFGEWAQPQSSRESRRQIMRQRQGVPREQRPRGRS